MTRLKLHRTLVRVLHPLTFRRTASAAHRGRHAERALTRPGNDDQFATWLAADLSRRTT